MIFGNIRAAFKDWTSLLGLLTTIAGLLSFLSRTLHVSLAEPVRVVIETFRAIFHPLIDVPLSLLHIQLGEFEKDAVLIWMAIGGAVGRTVVALYHANSKRKPFYSETAIGDAIKMMFATPVSRALLTLLSVFAWPALVYFGLRFPVVVETASYFTVLPRKPVDPGFTVINDLRLVLATQILTIILALATVLAASVFLA